MAASSNISPNHGADTLTLKHLKRGSSDGDGLTVGTYSTRSSAGSSIETDASTNLWHRLLSNDSVWDSINVVTNTTNSDHDHDEEEEDDLLYYREFHAKKKRCCKPSTSNDGGGGGACNAISILALTTYYELRHFLRTTFSHAHIWLTTLLVTLGVFALGYWAISSEKAAFIADKQSTAQFVARETGAFFATEFKRAFLPLYSLREAIIHSGHFDELAYTIGRSPNLLMEENVEVPGGLANVRDLSGICDTEDILEKWSELVGTSTRENDLDGMIFRYRLMPRNVACLEYKMGQAIMDSGMDMANSPHPFWSMVVKDLFLKRWNGLHAFGPFIAPNGKETFCTHLGIWVKPSNELELFTEQGGLDLGNVRESYTDIQGTEVENVWGFVMNYLDWTELKKRSNIYERFGSVGMDFELRRREEDVDFSLSGPQGDPTKNYALLAKSEGSHLLDDTNSILIETETLHGIWQNRVGIATSWNPDWWWPAVASVIAISILLGLLTASTLVKSQQNRDLTEKMMPKKAIKKLHRGQTVIEKYNLVTIFYADVVGFSGKNKGRCNLTPVQVMNVLNDLYSALDEIAERHGVYKVETVGNRYMVVGGALKQESARASAKRVALFAIDAMAYVDSSFLTSKGDKVYLRAGMSSGPAVAGCIGKSAPRYCFFGDTLDRASRLEKTSKKNKIQCCEVSHRLLNDAPGMKFIMNERTSKAAGINKVGSRMVEGKEEDSGATSYWIENASPCENCFELALGSWILDPCGHVLCAGCNEKHNLNVCPTCRCKVNDRTEWKSEGAHKIVDIDEASFVLPDLEEGGSDLESDNQ